MIEFPLSYTVVLFTVEFVCMDPITSLKHLLNSMTELPHSSQECSFSTLPLAASCLDALDRHGISVIVGSLERNQIRLQHVMSSQYYMLLRSIVSIALARNVVSRNDIVHLIRKGVENLCQKLMRDVCVTGEWTDATWKRITQFIDSSLLFVKWMTRLFDCIDLQRSHGMKHFPSVCAVSIQQFSDWIQTSQVGESVIAASSIYLTRLRSSRHSMESTVASTDSTLTSDYCMDQAFLATRSFLHLMTCCLVSVDHPNVRDIEALMKMATHSTSNLESFSRLYEPWLTSARSYFTGESTHWFACTTITQFVERVHVVIEWEDTLVHNLGIERCKVPHHSMLIETLVVRFVDSILDETVLGSLWTSDTMTALVHLFELIVQVDGLDKIFANILRRAIKHRCDLVWADECTSDKPQMVAIQVVSCMHQVEEWARNLVKVVCQNNVHCSQAAKLAMEEGVNKAGVHSFATLLGTSVHLHLTKHGPCAKGILTMEEQSLVHSRMLTYVRDKDICIETMRQWMAKRLLTQMSWSIEAERTMLSVLKRDIGFTFTEKLEAMLKDFETATRDKIRTSLMDVKVFKSSAWPVGLNLSCEPLKQLYDSYARQYAVDHPMRTIVPMMEAGRVTLRLSIAHESAPCVRELVVMPIQACILMLLVESEMTLGDLADKLALDAKHVISFLAPLMLVRPGGPKQLVASPSIVNNKIKLAKTSVLGVFRGFTSPVKRIEYEPIVLDTVKAEQDVSVDRVHMLEANIVRLMKSRKRLAYESLVAETCESMRLFVPAVRDVKRCIESLIEKEYLERDPIDKNTMVYLP